MKLRLIPTDGQLVVNDAKGSFVIKPRRTAAQGHYVISVFIQSEPLTDFTEEEFMNEPAALNAMKHRAITVTPHLSPVAHRAIDAGAAFMVK